MKKPSFVPASRVTLHSEVMRQITTAIQEGAWTVGSKLPGELALAEMFQVSRTCIREVLKALSYSGVVESRPGLGTFLKEPPKTGSTGAALVDWLKDSTYTDMVEVRSLLLGQASYWACQRATQNELDDLEAMLRGKDGGSLREIHKEFHQAVVKLAKNPVLYSLVTQLESEYLKQRELHFSVLPDSDRLEHWEIFDAIKKGPPSKARKAMTDHVRYIWKKSDKSRSAVRAAKD